MNDDTAFSARHDSDGPVETRLLLQQDGARHDARRRIVARALGSRHVLTARASIAAHARALVDELVRAGGGDLVDDLARPLTRTSVADLVGLPTEQRERVFGWVAEILHDDRYVPERIAGQGAPQARLEFARFVGEQIEARRREDDRSDALGRLLDPDPVTGVVLTDQEISAHARNLCQAASGATILLIGNVMYELLVAPDRYHQVKRRPELVATAVEESLRHDPPNNFVRRVCTAPVEVTGTRIDPDDEVMISLASANRDAARFSSGEVFRLDRGRPPAHLAFGWGPHYCVGAVLARTIAGCALDAVIAQPHVPSLAPHFVYERQTGLAGLARRGPRHLDVTYDGTPLTSSAS
jgi:cytochrome P450